MALGITLQKRVTNIQCLVVELIQMVHAEAHVYGNDLPGLKAEVALFKQRLELRVWHRFDGKGNRSFEIHPVHQCRD